jgi:hypothetical protein
MAAPDVPQSPGIRDPDSAIGRTIGGTRPNRHRPALGSPRTLSVGHTWEVARDADRPRAKWVDAWYEVWLDPPPEPGLEGAVQRVITRLATGEAQPGYGRFLQLNDSGLRIFADLAEACGGTRPRSR